jgi:beta-lactamase class A
MRAARWGGAGVLVFLVGCVAAEFDRMAPLERKLRLVQVREAPEAQMSLWLAHADGRELLAIHADQPMEGASTLKVLILVEAHAQVIEGTFHFADSTTLQEEDRVEGSGSLKDERPGSQWTWRQLARKMILESDNTASNLLLGRLGMRRVNERAERLGLSVTRFERPYEDREARRLGLKNRTTAREMGRLLGMIYRKEILTPEACQEMIDVLERTSRGRIAAGVPRDIPVGHKSGRMPGLRHDVGWVRLPGRPYVLSIFLDNVLEKPYAEDEPDRGIRAIEAVARVVFETLGPSEE